MDDSDDVVITEPTVSRTQDDSTSDAKMAIDTKAQDTQIANVKEEVKANETTNHFAIMEETQEAQEVPVNGNESPSNVNAPDFLQGPTEVEHLASNTEIQGILDSLVDPTNIEENPSQISEGTDVNITLKETETDSESENSDQEEEESSSSDEDTDSDSSTSTTTRRLRLQAQMEGMVDEDDSDDEDERPGANKISRPKTLYPEDELKGSVVLPDIVLPPTVHMKILGQITSIISNTIVIHASLTAENRVLDLDTPLFNDKRNVIGIVFDIFGPVSSNYYSVRFNDLEEISSKSLVVGSTIYFTDDTASFVFTKDIRKIKGSDASAANDKEPAEDEVEFSDDEQEREYKAMLKKGKKMKKQNDGSNNDMKTSMYNPLSHSKRQRPNQQSSPLAQNNTQLRKNTNYQQQKYSQQPAFADFPNIDWNSKLQGVTAVNGSVQFSGPMGGSSGRQQHSVNHQSRTFPQTLPPGTVINPHFYSNNAMNAQQQLAAAWNGGFQTQPQNGYDPYQAHTNWQQNQYQSNDTNNLTYAQQNAGLPPNSQTGGNQYYSQSYNFNQSYNGSSYNGGQNGHNQYHH